MKVNKNYTRFYDLPVGNQFEFSRARYVKIEPVGGKNAVKLTNPMAGSLHEIDSESDVNPPTVRDFGSLLIGTGFVSKDEMFIRLNNSAFRKPDGSIKNINAICLDDGRLEDFRDGHLVSPVMGVSIIW